MARILTAPARIAVPLARRLGVAYVMVVCGASAAHAGDDIAKLRWPIRIAAGVFPDGACQSCGLAAPRQLCLVSSRFLFWKFHLLSTHV